VATDPSKALSVTPQAGALTTSGAAEYNLDGFPTAQYNRLIPTQTIMTTDLLAPVVQVVKLDIDRDCYSSPDVPGGSKAIGRVGLRKLVTAAGISILDNRRTDDARDPDVCEMTATGEMILPTGQRIRAIGVKRIDLKAQKWASDNQRAKFRSFFQEHVASRAENRCVRALLSLQASYPVAELAKPFAVVSFVPNTANPEVRAAMIAAMAPSIAALYGPDQAKAIGPGQVTEVEQAPDDDVVEGQATEPIPDWMAGAHRLLAMLVDNAASSQLEGTATEDQLQALRETLAPFNLDAIAPVLRYAYGTVLSAPDKDHPRGSLSFTAAQAEAILAVEKSLATPEFRALWIELGQVAAAKGGAA
jgi:hypothetical protein